MKPARPDEIAAPGALDLSDARPARRGRWIALALVLVLITGVALWLAPSSGNGVVRYLTTPAARGDLTVSVIATGTLQPTNQVDVGSELSGTITEVFVEDNSLVKAGQVLARLDTAKLEDSIASTRAALASAEAGVLQARATEDEAKSNLARLEEVARLSGGRVPSKAELDTGRATLARARANLAAARAAVAEARAALSSSETNLAKASIKSPIDGVVLLRQVEPGQTVAASLQAPVLFTLAEDLARMDLEVNVDEADVGQVAEDQSAAFTVDAWPERKYPATITRVSYGAQTTDNVVSYLTTLKVDNDDLSLRPGMTATAEITTSTRRDVLLVPNAALRFTPPAAAPTEERSLIERLIPRPPRPRAAKTVKPANGQGTRSLWVLREGAPVAVAVRTGVSDGRMTEIVGGELAAGDAVITDSAGTRQ